MTPRCNKALAQIEEIFDDLCARLTQDHSPHASTERRLREIQSDLEYAIRTENPLPHVRRSVEMVFGEACELLAYVKRNARMWAAGYNAGTLSERRRAQPQQTLKLE